MFLKICFSVPLTNLAPNLLKKSYGLDSREGVIKTLKATSRIIPNKIRLSVSFATLWILNT